MPRKCYHEAMHAVQTGVQVDIDRNGQDRAGCSPKHLRVGMNSALINDAALAALLIRKGVITQEEYEAEVTTQANIEVERYERHLAECLGGKIELH